MLVPIVEKYSKQYHCHMNVSVQWVYRVHHLITKYYTIGHTLINDQFL